MMRPLVKYPVNHRVAQVLERSLVAVAARVGPAIAEAGIFGGDEPTSPSSLPRLARFGDSWSARLTALPAPGVEVQGSLARVASPEEPLGFGLDQRKRSYSARAEGTLSSVTAGPVSGYPFVEVARLWAASHDDRTLFQPDRFYGTTRFWLLTAGVRLRAGAAHSRMGRYGVALAGGPPIGVMGEPAPAGHAH